MAGSSCVEGLIAEDVDEKGCVFGTFGTTVVAAGNQTSVDGGLVVTREGDYLFGRDEVGLIFGAGED